MRSTAPAIASAPPLISASLVLVGNSTASPVGAFSPAVPISSARSIRPKPGRIRPPRKLPVGVEGIDGDRGADHDDEDRPRRAARQDAMARADQRDPAVDAEPRRVVVAVASRRTRKRRSRPSAARRPRSRAALRCGGGCPRRRRCCRACSHGAGRSRHWPSASWSIASRKTAPCATMPAPGSGRGVERPLEARVADVDGEKAHPVRAVAPQIILPVAGWTSQPAMRQLPSAWRSSR